MTEQIVEILRRAAERADESGAPYVSRKHVDDDELRTLCEEALVFLRTKSGAPSPIDGWTQIAASQAGLLPHWTAATGWESGVPKRFRPLRTRVYDRIEEHGLLVKPPGTGASIHVSPAGSMWDEPVKAPALSVGPSSTTKLRSPHATGSSLREQVDTAIRSRMTELVERIRSETESSADDYAAVGAGQVALDVLVRFMSDMTTTVTTKQLCQAKRPDLTVERAVINWSSDLPIPTAVVDNAAGRLAYWSDDD